MHEFYVVQNIIKTVEHYAQNYPDKKLKKVVLLIGKFSGVEPELLKTALFFFKKGTVIEEAEIVIELEDLRLKCSKCNFEFTKEKWELTCPKCGSYKIEIIAGDKMLLKTLEFE